jgi:condensin-2 complex subunit G2
MARGAANQPPNPTTNQHPPSQKVVTGKQWILEAVGEIILRGWREAVGPCAAAIEGTLIQVSSRWVGQMAAGAVAGLASSLLAAPLCHKTFTQHPPPPLPRHNPQGFARACLHASSKGLASNVLVVLHQLHEAKRLGPGAGAGAGAALDGALVRLYEPLLFRALSAANAAVRRNALLLLLDAFPLLVRRLALPSYDD